MKIIKLPIFKSELGYFYEPNIEKARKIVKKYTGKDYDLTGVSAMHFSKKGHSSFIWFKTKENSMIAHEVIHATYFILEECGIRHDESNHEVFAYLVGYLVKNIKL